MKIENENENEKEKKNKTKANRIATLLYFTFTEFLLFSIKLLSIETVLPIRTSITVYLMVFFAVDIFEEMRARLTFSCSKS